MAEKCYFGDGVAVEHVEIPMCSKHRNKYWRRVHDQALTVHWNEKKRRWEIRQQGGEKTDE